MSTHAFSVFVNWQFSAVTRQLLIPSPVPWQLCTVMFFSVSFCLFTSAESQTIPSNELCRSVNDITLSYDGS